MLVSIKRTFALTVAVFVLSTLGVSAVDFGAGLQMALNFSFLESPPRESALDAELGTVPSRQAQTGVAAGAHARLHFADFVGIQVAPQYVLMGGNYSWETEELVVDETQEVTWRDQARYHTFSLPVTAHIRVPITENYRIVPTGGAGPDFLISPVQRRTWDLDDDPEDEDLVDEDWETIDAEYQTGFSYTVGVDVETDMEDVRGVGAVGVRYTQQFVSYGPVELDPSDYISLSNLQLMVTFTRLF